MTPLPMTLMSDEEVARFGRPDAGFGALEAGGRKLPLAAMEVDARVTGVIAAVELAQVFVNTTGAAIEATYIFPLPDRAAVHRFRMEVAGRVVEGVVDERGAAREQYDRAIAAGHRASIAEEERPGVFTLRVGNLLPGETAVVRLSLVGPLPVDDGEVTFRFPLVVAPRYMPGSGLGGEQAGLGVAADTTLVPDASRISPPVLLPGCPNPVRLGLRVALEDHAVRDVASSLHAVTESRRDAHVVEVRPGERLDRDFILRWRIDGAALRSSLVCADDADGRGGSFQLTLIPPSTTTAAAAKPRDVVFVIDRSGSMQGWKMVAARRAAARMIDTLTSRDRFCAIAFDHEAQCVPVAGLVDATDRQRYRAVEALAKLDGRGGTELAVPLQLATRFVAGGHDDRERVIVLITDGQVGNEDHILRELAPALRKVRMFTLGIDQAVNAGFLRRLAAAGGGLCELVESEDRLDGVMAKVHRRIGAPVATELRLTGAGLELDARAVAPERLPDVYAGAPVTVFGRYRGRAGDAAAIELEGTTLGEPLRVRIVRDASAAAEARDAGRWLHASWARARIRDLEDRYAANTGGQERWWLEEEIVRVSKLHGVLSRFTAFLAVDRSEVANPRGIVQPVVQPVEPPAGWAGGGYAGPPPPSLGMRTQAGIAGGASAAMMPPAAAGPASMRIAKLSAPAAPPAPGMMGRYVATEGAPPAEPPAPSGLAPGALPFGGPPPMPPGAAPPPPFGGPPPMPAGAAPPAGAAAPRPSGALPYGGPPPMPAPPILPAVDAAAYLDTLRALGLELEAAAARGAEAIVLRRVRQRLVEWVEDLRSVAGHDALTAAVEQLAQRLAAAIAAGGAGVATEAAAVAAELVKLAGGAPPPPLPKRAFWK